jgi:hypothetical protein
MDATPHEGAALRRVADTLLTLAGTPGASAQDVDQMRAIAAGLVSQAESLEQGPGQPLPPSGPALTLSAADVRALQAVSRELLALTDSLAPGPGAGMAAAVRVGSVQGLARALARRLAALG